MTQRTQKVASIIQHIAAAELAQIPGSAYLTVTKVDVTPDLRHATVWVGVVATNDEQAETLLKQATDARSAIQAAVAGKLQTKFVPRLTVTRDIGGEYADEI